MVNVPKCPQCSSEYTYEDNGVLICPACAHEWSRDVESDKAEDNMVVKDAHGTILKDGDSVALIKDLKIKGSSSVIKAGTKVKNIRLVDEDHNIDCKIDGFGKMGLKSEFVKKI
jgi:protein PhnA